MQGYRRSDEQTGTTSVTTSTITATETAEALPPPHSSPLMVPAPGWGPRRPVLPSTANPDPDPQQENRAPAAAAGASGSSGQSTASIRAFSRDRAKSYAKVAETLFRAVGGILNGSASKSAGADTDAFLPDDDDLDVVPPPLGRLAARRVKFGADPDQLNDLEDLGMVAVGLIAWAAKGVSAVFEARRLRRRLEADKTVHTDPGDGR